MRSRTSEHIEWEGVAMAISWSLCIALAFTYKACCIYIIDWNKEVIFAGTDVLDRIAGTLR